MMSCVGGRRTLVGLGAAIALGVSGCGDGGASNAVADAGVGPSDCPCGRADVGPAAHVDARGRSDAAAPLPDAAPPDAALVDGRVLMPDARPPVDAAPLADAPLADARADCGRCPDAGGDARTPDAAESASDAGADAARPGWAVRRLFSDADGLSAPDGLHRMADGRVLVANQVTGDLQVIDPVAGTVSLFFQHFPGLTKPEETADGPAGEVYVSDNVSRVVHRLAPDGTHAAVLGPADGLVEPKGLAVHPDGTLVVADEGASRIVAYPPAGEPVVLVDASARAAHPESLQRAPDGTLYCTDDHLGGVLRISPEGVVDEFLSAQQVRYADAVSVAPGGDLWFSEANPNTGPRLLHYSSAGVLLDTIAVPGPGRMLGVAALADGRVLTAFYQAPYLASEIWVAEPLAP